MTDRSPSLSGLTADLPVALPDLVVEVDPAGIVVAANELATKVLWAEDGLLGRPLIDVVHPDDGPAIRFLIGLDEPASETPAAIVRLRRSGGRFVTVELQAEPMADGGRRLRSTTASTDNARARFFERASDSFVVLDDGGVILDCNRAYASSVGIDRAELLGTPVLDHVDVEVDLDEIRGRVRSTGYSSHANWEYRRHTGRWLLVQWESSFDPLTKTEYLVGRDLTGEQEVTAALRTSERFFDLSTELMAVLGPDTRIEAINGAFCRFLGRSSDDLLDTPLDDVVHPDDLATVVASRRDQQRQNEPTPADVEVRFRADGGEWRTLAVRSVWDPDEQDTHLVARDVTDELRLTAELRAKATIDALTGLANRSVFQQRLSELIASGRTQAVLLLDLDDFKLVNDSLGHLAGDALLMGIADRLTTAARDVDLVARLGGDEFGVVAPGVTSWDEAAALAERITAAISKPFDVEGHRLHTSCSVGVTLARPDRSPEDLLAEADTAAYWAKELGKHRYELYDDRLRLQAAERLRIETDLRQSIGERHFDIDVQPIVDLDGGAVVGSEALLRWCHPERGRTGPGELLAVAERTGLIVPIGLEVLDLALETCSRWLPTTPGVGINVNLAVGQLLDPDLDAEVADGLERWGVPGGHLTVEVTESALMEEAAVRALTQLRQRGVQVAIDDFGTGYSNLSYLRRLPIDVIKVDRSFVVELNEDPAARSILRAIVDLSRALEMDVVIEGIEEEPQRQALLELGCRFGQGFLFHRPMQTADAVTLIGARPALSE